MNTRYFSFGCSYVNSFMPTVCDLIGSNFDEHIQAGRGAGCNELSSNRLFSVHDKIKLNPNTDFVTIGTTGTFRFSLLYGSSQDIMTGDYRPSHSGTHPKLKLFSDKIDSPFFALRRSYYAIKKMKILLDELKINYIIYPSLPIHYANVVFDKDEMYKDLEKEYMALHNWTQDIDNFWAKDYLAPSDTQGVKFDDGTSDGHHGVDVHYEYLRKYFHEFDTEKTRQYINNYKTDGYDFRSLEHAGNKFNMFGSLLNKRYVND